MEFMGKKKIQIWPKNVWVKIGGSVASVYFKPQTQKFLLKALETLQ